MSPRTQQAAREKREKAAVRLAMRYEWTVAEFLRAKHPNVSSAFTKMKRAQRAVVRAIMGNAVVRQSAGSRSSRTDT